MLSQEIAALPPSALQGLPGRAYELLAALKIHTLKDLAKWKYAAWAEAIASLAKYETDLSSGEAATP